jgi:Zn-dependent membrane protease YugP
MFFDTGYMIIAGVLTVIGFVVQQMLQSKFSKYSKIGLRSGMSGAEVAEAMLRHYGISDVKVVAGQGYLTDHYNPLTKTVSLSEPVYHERTISAAAVAAHECGHAVQHAEAYSMLQLRSKLVPAVNLSASLQQYVLIAAFLTINTFPQVMMIAIILFAITALFSFVTLPVEFDASRRALAWLDNTGVAKGAEYDGAKDALKWAAMTYVSAALSALVMLIYLILRMSDRR